MNPKMENLINERKIEGGPETIKISLSEKEAKIEFSNLSLQTEQDHSNKFEIDFEKDPLVLEKGGIYAQYNIYDFESEKMKSISGEVLKFKDLPEKELLHKILEILRNNISYPYKETVEEVKKTNPDLAKWLEENLSLSNLPANPNKLSEIFEKGYGICGNLSLAYIYLAEKVGLNGIILSGDELKNIERSDNGQPLFKSRNIGEPAPSHVWCEIKLKNGEWFPVDPSTKLIGDENGISDFKKANYIGRPAILPCEIEINPRLENGILSSPIKIDFLPGEKYGKAECCVYKKKVFKKDFVPYKGNCELKINILSDKENDLKIKFADIHEIQ
jgi:hypothetical protein